MATMKFQEQENIPLNCFKRKLDEIEDRTTYETKKVYFHLIFGDSIAFIYANLTLNVYNHEFRCLSMIS